MRCLGRSSGFPRWPCLAPTAGSQNSLRVAATGDRDAQGFILTGTDLRDGDAWPLDRDPLLLETSLPGVFAAGDVRHGSAKRVASAVGEGSIAIQLLHRLFVTERLQPRGRPREPALAGGR